ncbi:aminoglycoside phosphotransferase family protein [Methylomonas sp. MgM2]
MYYPSSDSRAKTLLHWLSNDLVLPIQTIESASSDASFRRYFRVRHSGACYIVMDAPPDKEDVGLYIRNADLFRKAGIHVPDIFQQNRELGFLLLEDLGNRRYLECLAQDNADALYRNALDSLFRLQSEIDIDACELPQYDRSLLSRELGIFHEWFLEKRLGIVLPVSIRQALEACLIESAMQQPRVCVHRDFHSRNLMILDNHSPGVIDFQDAVVGPITYDLVSLLRDCYIRWPEARVQEWMERYYRRLIDAELTDVTLAKFKRWFDLMGLQRHLKAVGIFSRLHLRDDKPGYLSDIPRTIGYITDVCEKYSELESFNAFLQLQVLPFYQTKL